MRRLIHERTPLDDRLESGLERRFLKLTRSAGLPPPEAQYEVRDGGVVARLDFAYPSLRLGIEVDGYRYHAGKARWERDLERRNWLESRGWRILNITWAQLREKPGGVVSLLRCFFPDQGSLFA